MNQNMFLTNIYRPSYFKCIVRKARTYPFTSFGWYWFIISCIPSHIAIQLDLKEFEKREVTVADGTKHLCPYVGPIRLQVANRQCLTGALVLGEEVLLGAIPIEDMDMIIHPAQLKLMPNPQNPNILGAIVK
jgi:hypothetical protein